MTDTFSDLNDQPGLELMPGTTSWAATGEQLQLVLTTIEPGREFPLHSHSQEQFLLVLEGTIEFEVEGKGSRALGPRGLFYFAPNERHGARVIGDKPVTIVEAFHPIRLDYAGGGHGADGVEHDVPR